MPIFLIKDFSGGMRNNFRQNSIGDNESPSLRNARFSLQGALTKREGTTRYQATNGVSNLGALVGAFSYQTSSGSEQFLLMDNNGELVRSTSVGTYTSVATGLGSNAPVSFLILNDNVYIANQVTATRKLNSSNVLSSVSGYPAARWHVLHKRYPFTLNTTTNPNRLQWGNQNDAETWTSTNFEDIEPNDGLEGSGLISFGDELLVFKHRLSGNNNWARAKMYSVIGNLFSGSNPTYYIIQVPLPENIGLIFPKTAKVYGGSLIFLTTSGFYAYDGGLKPPYPISEPLRGEYANLISYSASTGNNHCAATIWNNKYICSVFNSSVSSSFTFPNTLYIYENGKWWRDIIGAASDANTSNSSPAVDWFVFGGLLYSASGISGTTSGIIRQWFASGFSDTQDDNTAENVNFSYSTKEFDFGNEQVFPYCYLHLRRQTAGTLTFETNIDQRGVTTNSVSMTAPDTSSTQNSSSNILRKKVPIGGHGNTIQFRFFNRENNDVEIYAIELHHSPAIREQV